MSPYTMWRLHYKLPPNDPRALEVDDETVLRDLLVITYRDHRLSRLMNPELEQEDQANKRSAHRRMMTFKKTVLRSGLGAAVAKFLGPRDKRSVPVTRIRMRREP